MDETLRDIDNRETESKSKLAPAPAQELAAKSKAASTSGSEPEPNPKSETESKPRLEAEPKPLDVANHYLKASTRLREALRIPKNALLTAEPLGQGEHNANFWFQHPETGKRLALRINYSSQLGLDKQATYEFSALEALQPSGRTPKALFLDDDRETIERGVIVMEYVTGDWLDFERPGDVDAAAAMLADIHAVKPSSTCQLIRANDPLKAQFENCKTLYANYRGTKYENATVAQFVERFFQSAEDALSSCTLSEDDCMHIINTEAVNSHFLIPHDNPPLCSHPRTLYENADGGHVVDWEKAVIGEVAQDVAYFLSPTTTIWDTDFIFDEAGRKKFIETYWKAVDGRFPQGSFEERFRAYVMTNCLVGITWSCNAWVEYHSPNRPLKNEKTLRKLGIYLSEDFLNLCERICFNTKGSA